MSGFLVIALAVVTALLAAASLRLPGLASSLLAAYLAMVANLVIVVVVLSPFRAVTRGGLAVAEACLFAVVLGGWWLRGRPRLPLGRAGAVLRAVTGEPVAAAFLVVTAAILGYELLLVLAVPPNNWDSLTYHLARVASWVQFHGYHWIPNAPSDRLNEFQPLAEQELLFLFAATGKATLYAVPQYVSELAILVAVYGASRRLGFDARSAACGAFLLATFSLVALQATTSQNDLVAASFPVVAACLLLGDTPVELVLGGLAAGMGAGVKLTTLLVWPVLALLLWRRGSRSAFAAAAGLVAGVAAVGMWGYVLNLIHTGHVLGYGASRVEISSNPAFPGSLQTALHVVYRTLDLSVLSNTLIYSLAAAGVAVGAAVGVHRYRQAGVRRGVRKGVCVAAPLLAPLVAIGAGALLAVLTRIAGIPVHDSSYAGGLNRIANEDYAAFGPVGGVLLLALPVIVVLAYRARAVDVRQLALGLALPVFLVLLVLQAKYNPFLTRFLLVPAALSAPLFARFFRGRIPSLTLALAASIVAGLTLSDNQLKPLARHPWELTQSQAVALNWQPSAATALDLFRSRVPPRACVGVLVGADEPSYLLYGAHFEHRIDYLPPTGALAAANAQILFYAVVSVASDQPAVDEFGAAGWKLEPLSEYWDLAISPARGARTGDCFA